MSSGQKFVARNRAPRVQIEYDVELYGAQKSVQLPFVMGVMADLSGASEVPVPAVADRKFLEIDVDNLDDRMKAMRPRAAFHVPNTLSGEGSLPVDLSFERMEDFSPAAVARRIAPLASLLEARTQLAHLATYMDGKAGAEALIARLIADPATLAGLAAAPSGTGAAPDEASDAALDALRGAGSRSAPAPAEPDPFDALRRAGARPEAPAPAPTDALSDAALDALRAAGETAPAPAADDGATALDALRATGQTTPTPEADAGASALDALRAAGARPSPSPAAPDPNAAALDALRDMGTAPRPGHDDLPGAPADADDDLGALLGGAPADAGDDLDALLGGAPANPGDDLDNLLSGGPADVGDGLDDLLDGAPADADALAGPGDDFDAPLGDAPAPSAIPFGRLTRARPAGLSAPRARFRIAILGDFSGRAARGALEGGPALAARRPVRLDIDDLDAVIARFATRLTLPLGADGAGVEIPLASLDDLHPDALVGSLPLFDALVGLRARVARGEPAALAEMQARAPEAAAEAAPAPAAPRGTHVPARPLTALQALLGDAAGALARPSPAEDLIARIVAPHVRAAPDPRAPAMTAACDAALASALRGILHHPDFRTVESTWRALDLIARRVGGGGRVEIMLHDISAAEWAADIAAHDDLADSALFAQLAEAPLLDEAQGPYSAVFGLYTLEETPSHAELMARMAKIAAFMDAPFVAAIAPGFLDTAREDRAPATARAWDALRALPEAAWAALASPGVLLRLPYGARTEPVDGFDFEEVDGGQAGTGGDAPPGLLWANAAVLPAILLAEAAARGAGKPDLGGVMSLDGMPVHVMTDAHGDQVAAPCAERLLDTGRAARTVARGFIPVLSIKGRDVVRQGSFQALGAAEIHGPWAPAPCPDLSGEAAPSPAAPSSAADDLGDLGDLGDLDEAGAGAAAGEEDDIDLDALLAELDAAPASAPDDASAPAGGLPDGLDDDLADLLKDL